MLFAIWAVLLMGWGCTHVEGGAGNLGEKHDMLTNKRRKPPVKVSRIAFGSCSHQDKDQPILNTVVATDPDMFIYLGDNIYGDTRDMSKLENKYARLGAKKEFRNLWDSTFVLATWDDHDYGENDAGRFYPQKQASKEIFMDFWGEPRKSERRLHPGIYHSMLLGEPGKRVQVILLDNRTFRSDLLPNNDKKKFRNDYRPIETPDSTFLGEAQWKWLEKQLKQAADVRIIATSTQFGISYNGYEAWANFPHEQQRMIDLISSTKAEGVVFISGDVHYGELSVIKSEGVYPLYDITSSGITQEWPHIEPNTNRIYKAEAANNFGLLDIDWETKDPTLKMGVYKVDGKPAFEKTIKLSELTF